MTSTDRLRSRVARHRPGALGTVGLIATLAAFTVTAGPLGAIAGLALALCSVLAPPLAVFGLGQAAVLALLPTPTPLQLALVNGPLVLVLVAPAGRSRTARLVAVSGLLFAGFAVAVLWASPTIGLQTTALGLLLGVGFGMYSLHRYERVVVGLAGGDAA